MQWAAAILIEATIIPTITQNSGAVIARLVLYYGMADAECPPAKLPNDFTS
jgi:hypothetical protein